MTYVFIIVTTVLLSTLYYTVLNNKEAVQTLEDKVRLRNTVLEEEAKRLNNLIK